MTRAMFVASTSKRLNSVPVHVLRMQEGDFSWHGSSAKVNIDDFIPRKLKSENSDATPTCPQSEVLQSAIDNLKTTGSAQDLFVVWRLDVR